MATAQEGNIKREIEWVFNRDLSTLACHAAIEIDSLITAEYRGLKSVQELADRIAHSIPETQQETIQYSMIDPTAVLIMNQAIGDTNIDIHLNSINDYIKEASLICEDLKEVSRLSETHNEYNNDKLIGLKKFCLSLSEKASTYQQTHKIEKQHPYRV